MFGFYDVKESDKKLFKPQKTFGELSLEIGLNGIFQGTEVDGVTQKKLLDYFYMENICANQDVFLWIFRRELEKHYPVYKDQLDSWIMRKGYSWFYDLDEKETKEHWGEYDDKANNTDWIHRTLDRTVDDHAEGKSDSNSVTDTTLNHSGNQKREGTSDTESTTDEKRRGFTFNFPESNYTGGNIPYDLNEDPNSEFLNMQTDALSTSTTTTHGETTDEGEDTFSDTGKDTTTATTETETTGKQTTDESGIENRSGEKTGEGADHYKDVTTRDRGDVNKIMKEIVETLPLTDFFKQFVDKLGDCFQHTYLPDQIIDGLL